MRENPAVYLPMSASVLIPTESAEQKAVIVWWAYTCAGYNLPECVLMACPSQAARSIRGGARMKAEGYRSGTPDLFLAAGRHGQHGLFIEMKRSDGGVLSENQKAMLFELSGQNYRTAVACGAAQARKVIAEYLTP